MPPTIKRIAERILAQIRRHGLLNLVRRFYQRFLATKPSITVERFVYSDESSSLGDHEYDLALKLIERLKTVIRLRDSADPQRLADQTALPASNWDRARGQHFELDGKDTNSFTTSDLVLSGDYAVLRKLRLYSQAFTGYQLATLEFNYLRPWIRDRLPDNLDEFLRLIVSMPDDMSVQIPAVMSKLPEKLRISPPLKFGEMGWMVNGRIINYDVYSYLYELCLMYENGVLQCLEKGGAERCVRVLEIGGGYGSLAYYLMKIYGNLRYVIVDIPESLLFSSIYLTTLFPDLTHELVENDSRQSESPDDAGFTFVPNLLMEQISPTSGKFDLVINTLSLTEMNASQIVYYCKKVRELIKPEGMFFEHNVDNFGSEVEDIESLIKKNFSPNFVRCKTAIMNDPSFRGRARIWTL